MRAASDCGAIRGLATAGSGSAQPNPSDGVAQGSSGLSARTYQLWLAAMQARRRADALARRTAQ